MYIAFIVICVCVCVCTSHTHHTDASKFLHSPLLSCKLRRSTITRKPPGLSRRRWRAQLFSLWAPPIHHCFDWLLTKTWMAVMGKHGFILYILDLFIYIYYICSCMHKTHSSFLKKRNVLMSDATRESASNVHYWLISCTNNFSALFVCHLASTFGTTDLRDDVSCQLDNGAICTPTLVVLFYIFWLLWDRAGSLPCEIVRQCGSAAISDMAYLRHTPAQGFRTKNREHSDQWCWKDRHGECKNLWNSETI